MPTGAMPSSRAKERRRRCPSCSVPRRSSTAGAVGVGSVVDVLLIHSESPAAAAMKASTCRRGSSPASPSTRRAMRRWTPQRSRPRATMNAPRKSITRSLISRAARPTARPSRQSAGSRTAGVRDAAPWEASVIHQAAVKRVTPAARRCIGSSPGSGARAPGRAGARGRAPGAASGRGSLLPRHASPSASQGVPRVRDALAEPVEVGPATPDDREGGKARGPSRDAPRREPPPDPEAAPGVTGRSWTVAGALRGPLPAIVGFEAEKGHQARACREPRLDQRARQTASDLRGRGRS